MDIGLPTPARVPLGVADFVTENWTLTAYFTLHEMFLLYLCVYTR